MTKVVQNHPKIGLGGCLGASCALLGLSWHREGPKSKKRAKTTVADPPLAFKLGAKIHPKSTRWLSKKQYFFGLVLRSGFGSIWCQLRSNLEAKAFPKSSQVGSKIDPKLRQDVDQNVVGFLIILGTFFLSILFPSLKAEGPKNIAKKRKRAQKMGPESSKQFLGAISSIFRGQILEPSFFSAPNLRTLRSFRGESSNPSSFRCQILEPWLFSGQILEPWHLSGPNPRTLALPGLSPRTLALKGCILFEFSTVFCYFSILAH